MAIIPDISVIGVDGGATTCRFALVHGGQRYDVTRAGANASSDWQGTIATLREGLEELAEAAGLAPSDMVGFPAYLGLAGVMDTDMATRIAAEIPLPHAMIEDDRRTAMVGALAGQDGCVIGIGTGSFLGRRAGGQDRLIGGWGLVLADEASGAALGRQALRCVLDVADGLRAETPLSRMIAGRIGPPPAIVAFAASATPKDFATLAPDIIDAARDNDAIALRIMETGAGYLARTLSQLGWQPGEAICPIGGIAPHYPPYLPPDMGRAVTQPAGTALDGALTLAANLVRE